MLLRPPPGTSNGAEVYQTLCSGFRWNIPEFYNIGVDACDKWADGSHRPALIYEDARGEVQRYDFDQLRETSNRLANRLRADGVQGGDRIAVLLPQAPETALTHLASYKLGAIAVPLFTLFGVEALEYRLADSGARALVTDLAGWRKIEAIQDRLPALRTVYCVDLADAGSGLAASAAGPLRPVGFAESLLDQSTDFVPVATRADTPALIIYTSGTTGKPKGALHAHRVLLGHLPGVEMSHELFPEQATLIWTPADWAWIGGLLDVLLPAWHHGVTVLARRFEKFSAEAAFELMARHRVSNAFLPPTALKMLRAASGAVPATAADRSLVLHSVGSGGESLGVELIDWGRQTLGVTINEFYGQTECNMVVSSCSSVFTPSPGAIGRAAPGHDVAIVDAHGTPVRIGEEGNIAVRAPDPAMFLGYWNNPEATRAKFAGDYLLTGDVGVMDSAGFIRFVGRDDDVITSAGYRIGPGPIEDCLLGHPAVRMAAVVGKPDPERTEIVQAFIVLQDGVIGDEALVRDIQQHVRTRLAAHEYPRDIRFVDDLPMTTTGKVIRRELRQRG